MTNEELQSEFFGMTEELKQLVDTITDKGGKALCVSSTTDTFGDLIFRIHVSPAVGNVALYNTPSSDDRCVLIMDSTVINHERPVCALMCYPDQPQFAVVNNYAKGDWVTMASDIYTYLMGKPPEQEYKFHMPSPPTIQ